jgi:hypothetical protein
MTDDKCACEESLRLRKRVRMLVYAVRETRNMLELPTPAWERLNRAIKDDVRLAQAEETSVTVQPIKPGYCKPNNCPDCDSARERARREAEPYRPKVGERARLVSSPCKIDGGLVGRELALTATHPEGPDAGYWRARPMDEDYDVRIHRDSVWEPVAEKPEPPAPIPMVLRHAFDDGYDAGFEAGRASRDAQWSKQAHEADALRMRLRDELEAERDAHAATKAGLAALLDAIGASEHSSINHPWSRAIQYLENERAAHAATKAELDRVREGALDMADRLAEELQKARSARRLPTREAVIAALLGQADKLNTSPPALADAVLALFGAQEEQDSGYRPTIDEMVRAARAPLAAPSSDERPWNFDAPPDSEIGQQHELLPNDPENEAFELHTMIYSGLETRVDAQPRWDDKASGAYRVMGMSVAAWRRVAPAQPSLEGMPRNELESLKAEVAQLRGQIQDVSEGAKMRLDGLDKALHDIDHYRVPNLLLEADKRLDRLELDGRIARRQVRFCMLSHVDSRTMDAMIARLEAEEKGE